MSDRLTRSSVRQRDYRSAGKFVCQNPFHSSWKSPDQSRPSSSTRKCVLDVLSSLGFGEVRRICRSCAVSADRHSDITSHPLYEPPAKRRCSLSEGQAHVDVAPSTSAEDPPVLQAHACSDSGEATPICSALVSPQKRQQSHDYSGLEVHEDSTYSYLTLHEARQLLVTKDEEIRQLKKRVSELEQELSFDSQEKRVSAVKRIGRLENATFLAECQDLVSAGKSARQIDELLAIPTGSVSQSEHNPVLKTFVEELTKVESSLSNNQQRKMYQEEAMECLRGARHLKCVSSFHVAFQAIVYAVTGSRLAVDMIAHLVPGASYPLLQTWLSELGGEALKVPDGDIVVAFDNEQRLLKNYLSRGSNRSTLDVLTNVCCARMNEECKLQKRPDLHPRMWEKPPLERFLQVCSSPCDVLGEKDYQELLYPYLQGRISALCANGRLDQVEAIRDEMEQERLFIQCPGCKTLYEKRRRVCQNAQCPVGNVRQAIAEAAGTSRVSTEHHKEKKAPKKKDGKTVFFDISGPAHFGGTCAAPVLKPVSLEKNVTGQVKIADVHLLEPCFVNPNSHEAVSVLFRQLGQQCGVKKYGGAEREWLAIECDGLPYTLSKSVIDRSREEANGLKREQAGIPAVARMTKEQIKKELVKRSLPHSRSATVQQLRQLLGNAIRSDIETGKVVEPAVAEGEFDWVVLRCGGLHWEMKLVQCIVEVMWPFVYKCFADSQGYTTERQQEWVKSCKDHHRSFDELSRFIDGTFDELLYPYVHGTDEPTSAGFFEWAEQFKGNLTYTLLLQLTTHCCFGLIVYRHGVRHNKPDIRFLGRRAVSPLLHARHHPNYQQIELMDEFNHLSYPAEIANFFKESSVLSRSGRSDAHQSMDAVLEELNSDVKAWVTGQRDSDSWKRVIRNLRKLTALRRKTLAALNLCDPLSHARTQPDYSAEVLRWRAVLRPFLTGGKEPQKDRPLESMCEGVELDQSAATIIKKGLSRKLALAQHFYSTGSCPPGHSTAPPVYLTMEEMHFFENDENKTTRRLKEEFDEMISLIVDPVQCEFWQSKMHCCKLHKQYVACVRELRDALMSSAKLE